MDGYSFGRHIARTITGMVIAVALVCFALGAGCLWLYTNCHYKLQVVNTTTQP